MDAKVYIKLVHALKAVVRIDDFAMFRKRMHKRFGKLVHHKKYTADEIVALMQQMGMKRGSLVCIHASMMEFYNYQGTADELIDKIMQAIGGEGTLMMPAFPVIAGPRSEYVFDPVSDRTGAGCLAETFRKYPGVKRSYNVRASVCAIGPLTDYLLGEHCLGHDCWDVKSPWYKLCLHGGLVFNLGLPRSYMGTFHHCVESILQYEHPYWQQFFSMEMTYKYCIDGVIHEYKNIDCEILRKTREKKVTRFFDSSDWQIRRLSNLEIKVFYTANCFPKMLTLGRKGIGVFAIPSTRHYNFN